MDPNQAGRFGPSAAYAFAYNRVIKEEGSTDEQAHAAGVAAHYAAVYGADAKKDRNGKFIQQGIGSESNPSANHWRALRKAEQMGLERPGTYERLLRAEWQKRPDVCRQLGLPEPERLGA